MFTSLHTHTIFSDGSDDVETMCRAAYAKGLVAIGFSCHAPIEKAGLSTFWHMQDKRLDEYVREVCAARQRWEGKIAVYLGLEVDYIKGLRCALDEDIKNLNLDYCIGSAHYLVPSRGEPFLVDGPAAELEKGIKDGFDGDGEAMVSAYWDAVLEMIALGGFDIVGHLDLVKKNNTSGKWFDAASERYMQRAGEAARAVAAAGLVVEINTGGMNRSRLSEPYPSLPIVRLLRRYNVPVMISADAHNANDIAGHYPAACQTLLDAGYTSHIIFQGRSGDGPVWQEAAINASF